MAPEQAGADVDVRFVRGVGDSRGAILNKAGIFTVADLLLRLPFRYEDRQATNPSQPSGLVDGQVAAAEVLVGSVHVRPTRRKGFRLVELSGWSGGVPVRAVWFNQAWLGQRLRPRQRLVLYGKVERAWAGAPPRFVNPKWEEVGGAEPPLSDGGKAPPKSGASRDEARFGRIVPIYERIGRVTPRRLRQSIHWVLRKKKELVGPGHLPREVVRRLRLISWQEALHAVHFPREGARLAEFEAQRSPGHRRLIFEEFFLYSLAFRLFREQVRKERGRGRAFRVDDAMRTLAMRVLPFSLTKSQRKAMGEIAGDLQSERPMRRLLQGDVGSGKTIIAVLAALIVAENGAQIALMAPTSVLAEQHFSSVRRLLEPHGIRTALLTARLRARERRETLAAVESGWAQLVVGTHSVIQKGAAFHDLGLAIVDEQHRFGVGQRGLLVDQGRAADLLVMTATPIPRTLQMAVAGDLDLSEITELPPGRQPVTTRVRRLQDAEEAYRLVRAEAARGRQTFYVCPTIEESDAMPGVGVEARSRELAEGPFRGLRVGLVHGRVPAAPREAVMRDFARGRLDVLVATTVIEVGVDVPNATVIVIEHAERFGLAQLHQLRGRVGRGADPATAILLVGDELGGNARRRLAILEASTDGFRIAEEDLEIRGHGEILGTRQSGRPLFRVGELPRDGDIFRAARIEAKRFFDSPEARGPDGGRILDHVRGAWGEQFGLSGTAG